MDKLLFSILIGLAAGVLDIVPMVIQRLPCRASISAFLQYLVAGIVITNIELPHIPWWTQGGLIAVLMALPVVVIVSEKDRKSVPIILGNAVVLGTLIGLVGHYLA